MNIFPSQDKKRTNHHQNIYGQGTKILLLIMTVLFFTIIGLGENYYVRTTGDDGNSGTSPDSDSAWATISNAANNKDIIGGDTIFVAPGIYNGDIDISNSGDPENPIVYYADTTGNRFGMSEGDVEINSKKAGFTIKKQSNIHIYYFNFENSQSSAIELRNKVEGVLIEGIYANVGPTALEVKQVDGNIDIRNSTFLNGNIVIRNSSEVNSIVGNTLKDMNPTAIRIKNGCNVNNIANNKITNIKDANGIYATKSSIGSISQNYIHDLSNGIAIYIDNCDNINSIASNEISGLNNNGLEINNSVCNYIVDNVISGDKGDAKQGIYIYGSDSNVDNITNNIISDFYKNYAISVTQLSGNINISKNKIYTTDRGVGGGILLEDNNLDNISIVKNEISQLRQNNHGIAINNSGATHIKNNLIHDAYGQDSTGIYINNEYTTIIQNNTIHIDANSGIYCQTMIGGSIRNNIVTGQSTYGVYWEDNFSNVGLNYNCVYNNSTNYGGSASPGTGALQVDPLYVDTSGNDFHIQSVFGSYHDGDWQPDPNHSPCIDAGDPTDDYGNEPQFNGDTINMGAYGNTDQASLSGKPGVERETYTLNRDEWIFLGSPLKPQNSNLEAVFGDDFEDARPYNVTDTDTTWNNWALIRWETDDSTSEYFSFGDGTPYQPPECKVGRGYFIYQDKREEVEVDVLGTPAESDIVRDISAKPDNDWYPDAYGYNMFANPFNNDVNMASFRIINKNTGDEYTISEAAGEGLISPYLITWDPDDGYVYNHIEDSDGEYNLAKWRGFWLVQLTTSPDLELKMPISGVNSSQSLAKNSKSDKNHKSYLTDLGYKYELESSSINDDWNWFLKFGIVSSDYELHDLENYIGTYEEAITSDDTLDPWDAPDFTANSNIGKKSENIRTENISLGIKKENGLLYAYDLHNSGFQNQTSWNLKIKNSSDKEEFQVVWPHINQVPQGIELSLLDKDQDTLVSRLRNKNGYTLSLSKDSTELSLVARKVEDNSAPEYSFDIKQDNYLEDRIFVYITPNEPLKELTARIDNQKVKLHQLNSPPNVYYLDYIIQGSEFPDIVINGKDYSGNENQVDLSSKIAKREISFNQESRIKQDDYTITFNKGSLSGESTVLAGRYKKRLTYPGDMDSIGKPISINSTSEKFEKPVELNIKNVTEDNAKLFKYNQNKWSYVSNYSSQIKVDEPGIYSLFSTDKTFRKDSSNSDEEINFLSSYPNPFNSSIKIKYALNKKTKITATIYNVLGKKVKTLRSGYQDKGEHSLKWRGINNNGKIVSSGIYFLKITSPSDKINSIQKFTFIK